MTTDVEIQARIDTLEAENAVWRARCSRVACILGGGRPKDVKLGSLERRALDLLDRCEAAERSRDAALARLAEAAARERPNA